VKTIGLIRMVWAIRGQDATGKKQIYIFIKNKNRVTRPPLDIL